MVRKLIKMLIKVWLVNFTIGFIYGFTKAVLRVRSEVKAQEAYNALPEEERQARLVASRDRFMCSAMELMEIADDVPKYDR